MKRFEFTTEEAPLFALLYEAVFSSPQQLKGLKQLRMFNRIADALDEVSEGNAEAIDQLASMLEGKAGSTLIRCVLINRKLTEAAAIALEDAEFYLMMERLEEYSWSGLVAREAEALLSKLAAAGSDTARKEPA